MSHRWMTTKDLSSAVRAQDILNSRIKRGEIDPSLFTHTAYIVCGCGDPGCGWIASLKANANETRNSNPQI